MIPHNKKNRVGEKYVTNEGYTVEIIEYFNRRNCTIRFDYGLIRSNVYLDNLIAGAIRNPLHKSVCGVGYTGIGVYKNSKIRNIWNDMITRCYDAKTQINSPSYKECFVVESWHNFQNFAAWYEENYTEGFHLDKDILIKGNKVYGPDTCDFVPREINNIIVKSDKIRGKYPIGVCRQGEKYLAQLHIEGKTTYLGIFNTPEEAFATYKKAKEKRVRQLANKWKKKISIKIYQALMNYRVEITD